MLLKDNSINRVSPFALPFHQWPEGGWIVQQASLGEAAWQRLEHFASTQEAVDYALSCPREVPVVRMWPGCGSRGDGPELPPFRCVDPEQLKRVRVLTIRDRVRENGQFLWRKCLPSDLRAEAQWIARALGVPA